MDIISLLGYSQGSPFAGNPYLDIHSPKGLIDMSRTPMDIIGTDEKGNQKYMKAFSKNPYKFKGKVIREVPVKQMGGMIDFLMEQDQPEQEEEEEDVIEQTDNQDVTSPNLLKKLSMSIAMGEDEEDNPFIVPTTGDPDAISAYGAKLAKKGNPYTYPSANDNTPKLSGTNEKIKYAYQFFLQKGLEPHHAAGIVGNLVQESGHFRDDVIAGTRKGDEGKATGIAQWHPDRAKELEKWASRNGMNPYSLDAQLEFVYHEARQRGDIGALSKTKTPEEAAFVFAKRYERPKIIDPNRINYAKQIYNGISR